MATYVGYVQGMFTRVCEVARCSPWSPWVGASQCILYRVIHPQQIDMYYLNQRLISCVLG